MIATVMITVPGPKNCWSWFCKTSWSCCMIKAIIFDFYGVICSDDYWKFVKADKNMPGKFAQLSYSVNLGELSWEAFVQKISAETGQSIKTVNRLYESEKINRPLAIYIEKLHKKYKTALLTNASSEFLRSELKKAGLTTIFDSIVMSSEVGMAKPDPRIFQHVINELGVKPEETVFVDDLRKHTDAARSLGIKTILFSDYEQFKKDLSAILNRSE
jgi:epoxide hydrolase-like predicted phosphatase